MITTTASPEISADHAEREGRRSYYCCRNAKIDQRAIRLGRKRCPQRVSVVADELDTWVWSEVETMLLNRRSVVAEIRRRIESNADSNLPERRERLSAELAALDRQAATLLDAYARSEGRLEWSTFEGQLARIDAKKAETGKALAAIERQANEERRGLARLDGLEDLVRRLGPRLANPDIETKALVLTELGVTVETTRTMQVLSWALPLPTGTESDMHFQIDLSDVAEPRRVADIASASPAVPR